MVNVTELENDELQSMLATNDSSLVDAAESELKRRIGDKRCSECGQSIWECPDGFEMFVAFNE